MPKNVLVINSLPENNQPLVDLLAELNLKDYAFILLSTVSNLFRQFQKNNWQAKKIFLGPTLNSARSLLIFFILLPILLIINFFYLTYFAYSKKVKTIICLNWNEKIIFTPLAKILNIKTIWLELPGINQQAKNKLLLLLCKLLSKRVLLISLTSFTKTELKKLGFNDNKVKVILPGIKLNIFERQETIFNKLAQVNIGNFHRKYFTIGTIADLNIEDSGQKIETLFQATKICLNVIANLQIIIVGDGKERKNLSWLAKKMEIGNLVWFVGEPTSPDKNKPSYLKKWLDSFDIFVVTNGILNLTDFNNCLLAMASGLPIIGPANLGLEDIFKKDHDASYGPLRNQAGILIEKYDKELLARQIIKLQQSKRLRLELGKNAKISVNKYFTIDRMVEKFRDIML
jgi:glycosyltransferase involved in cell wall biosynthesis